MHFIKFTTIKCAVAMLFFAVVLLFSPHLAEAAGSPTQLDITSPVSNSVAIVSLQGAGSVVNPYQISSADSLNLVQDNPSAYYILTQDIDLGVAPYNQGAGWNPIGTESLPFTGTFDGNGYSINNLYLNRYIPDVPNEPEQGLFGCIGGGTVKNLQLENASVSAGENTGILVGIINGSGTIENCSTGGKVTGTGSIGGLVGCINAQGSTATVIKSFSTAAVTIDGNGAYGSSGGLVGYLNGGVNVQECYATGSVSLDSKAFITYSCLGGLVGTVGGTGTVQDCYATGSVACSDNNASASDSYSRIGGLVGTVDGTGTIQDCYATGNVTDNNSCYIGGLVGYSLGTVKTSYALGYISSNSDNAGGVIGGGSPVTDCFYNRDTAGDNITYFFGSGALDQSTAFMKQEKTFTDYNWDFNNVWTMDTSSGYPFLMWQVNLGTSTQLVWIIQPGDAGTDVVLSPRPVLYLEDANGNRETGDSSSTVTVALTSANGATLSGTKTVTLIHGIATFTDLKVNTAGGYTLTATSSLSDITSPISKSFVILNVIFSEGFENTTNQAIPQGWEQACLDVDKPGEWTTESETVAPLGGSPYEGSNIARFNSCSASAGSSTRLSSKAGMSLIGCTSAKLYFWMYHDSNYSDCDDNLQPVVSIDGGSWVNVGSAISRYSLTEGWVEYSVDLNGYLTSDNIRIGFVGLSQFGNDIYLDNIMLSTLGHDQVAPTGLVGVSPTTAENIDGQITGVSDSMEYQLKGTAGFTAVTASTTSITGLAAGTYEVRYAAKTGINAGAAAEVVVAPTAGCLVTYQGAQARVNSVDSTAYDIRFIATINTLDASSVGFVFSKSEMNPTKGNSSVKSTTKVYTSITALDSPITAGSFNNADYIIACTVTGIPAADINMPLIVRAFSTVGTETTYTSVKAVTVSSLLN